ncbi:MAG: hypothetical protein FWH40_05580 [Coriobacteriia bacterium]|nr:hypothetical protein [Coriobacteriia bacterium]
MARKHFISCISVLLLCSLLSGCNIIRQIGPSTKGSASSETFDKVQTGEWEGSFSYKLANGKTETWLVYFDVKDDGKTITSVELVHYIGELTADTDATALFTVLDKKISNNAFEFSLTEMVSYSTHTYKGSVTFTSSKEASGNLNIGGDDYKFTATPNTA